MRFISVLPKLVAGEKITRKSWGEDEYVYFDKTWVHPKILKEDGKEVSPDTLGWWTLFNDTGWFIYKEKQKNKELD